MSEAPAHQTRRPSIGERRAAVAVVLLAALAPPTVTAGGEPSDSADFVGAPAPPEPSDASPLPPEKQQALFSLPPGFEIELVASEAEGLANFVDVVWDHRGRMWSMTAMEYPVDANDNRERAEALYKGQGRDKVVVFDAFEEPGPHTPRVFAEDLAIPLGLLPYKDGAYVQRGHDILFLEDTDGDGRADKRRTVLTGFGIHDSHLMPHRFWRAPGGWIYMAQGAFNKSQVRTTTGRTIRFNGTKLARFNLTGSRFQILTWGPSNIWGFVIGPEGETFMQEANDFGYSVVPYRRGGYYPGGGGRPAPYAPEVPPLADFRLGGTGLSGLARSDADGGFPGPYARTMYVANPVEQKVQSVRVLDDGPRYDLKRLPPLIRCSDPMFRPVAVHFGPDGCLYIVDWYNKIIAHNEKPRDHPDRDKTHGRIWRVRHTDQTPRKVPDLTEASEEKLLTLLRTDIRKLGHLTWQAIVDRSLTTLAPSLKEMAVDDGEAAATRVRALWALWGLGELDRKTVATLSDAPNRNLRREAVDAIGDGVLSDAAALDLLAKRTDDADPQVREAVIHALRPRIGSSRRALRLLVGMGEKPLKKPTGTSGRHPDKTIKVGPAFDRAHERYLIRKALTAHRDKVRRLLESPAGDGLTAENRLLAALALAPRRSATFVAEALPDLGRAPNEEELLRLARHPKAEGAEAALVDLLGSADGLKTLLKVRTRVEEAKIRPIVKKAAARLLDGDDASVKLGLDVAAAFDVASLTEEVTRLLEKRPSLRTATLRTLRRVGLSSVDPLLRVFRAADDPVARAEALATLASSGKQTAAEAVVDLWPRLTTTERREAVDRLSAHPTGAEALLDAVADGRIPKEALTAGVVERLQTVLGDRRKLKKILEAMPSRLRPVLRLGGKESAWADPPLSLEGAFTVETWIRLEEGITNADGILGMPGALDINFHDRRFRVWAGPERHDVVIADRPMAPNLWTHVAATRDEEGIYRLYIDGEHVGTASEAAPGSLSDLRIAWTAASGGTAGMLAEYRVWDTARTPETIRSNYRRTYGNRPDGLLYSAPDDGWGKLKGDAEVVRTPDTPPLLPASRANAVEAKLDKYRKLVDRSGDPSAGKAIAERLCMTCHRVGEKGRRIGPDLTQAVKMEKDALLRNILRPDAAIETGYHTYPVEKTYGNVVEGFLVSKSDDAVVVRAGGLAETRIERSAIRRAGYVRRSLMPKGLLESLDAKQVRDLFAYLRSLR